MQKYYSLSDNRSVEQCDEMRKALINDAENLFKNYDLIDRSCPICLSDQYVQKEPFHNTFSVRKCQRCASDYVSPAPSKKALSEFYNNGAFQRLMNEIYERKKSLGSFIIDARTEKITGLIKEQLQEKEELIILEIGCNNGSLLKSMQSQIPVGSKVKIFGIDIDSESINNAKKDGSNIEFINISAEDLSGLKSWQGAVDLICHFELIEHLLDPSGFFKTCKNILKENGLMYFTTPNAEGLEVKACSYNGKRLMWHSIMPPAHLNAFSTQNVKLFSILNGFNVLDVSTPGKLDVDCVSIYSERGDTSGLYAMISNLEDANKAWLQALISDLGASGSMSVVLKNA